ncbi:hypothetical protein ACJX0J_015442, partial [Zea mays]
FMLMEIAHNCLSDSEDWKKVITSHNFHYLLQHLNMIFSLFDIDSVVKIIASIYGVHPFTIHLHYLYTILLGGNSNN